jgi:rare lipoprotein A
MTMPVLSKGLAAVAVSMLLVAGCSGSSNTAKPGDASSGRVKVGNPYQIKGVWYHPKRDDGYNEVGIASWYGPGFHGRKTANGERYDMNAMTAAHKTLPMPSWVRVTNLENGRTAVLRVNDRGPFVAGRIIDVSKEAADELGFLNAGIARVRVENLATQTAGVSFAPSEALAADTPALDEPQIGTDVAFQVQPSGERYIQVASFSEHENARRAADRLENLGAVRLTPVSVQGTTFTRVRIGPLQSAEEATHAMTGVRQAGFPNPVIVFE